MSRDASQSPTSLQIARRLLAREKLPEGNSKPELVGATLHRTWTRLSGTLSDSMGENGADALFTRALARTESQHPALRKMFRLDEGGIHLNGVVASVESHGAAAVNSAMEALLASLIDILGRLIGEDMAIRLMDHDDPQSRTGDGAKSS